MKNEGIRECSIIMIVKISLVDFNSVCIQGLASIFRSARSSHNCKSTMLIRRYLRILTNE